MMNGKQCYAVEFRLLIYQSEATIEGKRVSRVHRDTNIELFLLTFGKARSDGPSRTRHISPSAVPTPREPGKVSGTMAYDKTLHTLSTELPEHFDISSSGNRSIP